MSDLQTTDRLWTLLYGTWGSPHRASRMSSRRDNDRKYSDIHDYSLTPAHLAGTATYATTLGAADEAWAGCKDYDSASDGAILGALAHAARQNITAAAIVVPGNRAHVWTFYDRHYPVADIRSQLRAIPAAARGKIIHRATRSGFRLACTRSRKRVACWCFKMASALILTHSLMPVSMQWKARTWHDRRCAHHRHGLGRCL